MVMSLACASMLFSTNSATALSGLLWESAMMRIAFQSSPILSLPCALLIGGHSAPFAGRGACRVCRHATRTVPVCRGHCDPTHHSSLFQSDPVLGSHSRHASEFAQIIGDHDQSFATAMAADLHVVRTAGRSRPLQFRPTLSVVPGPLG